jgi:hypothetical protein
MYIDPFWAGVVATIFAEMVAFFAIGFITSFKPNNKDE